MPLTPKDRQEAARASTDATKVHTYLKKNYPESTLGWVKGAKWRLGRVNLSKIDMARRPGGRDPEKVKGIGKAIVEGKKMEPVVLVDTGDQKGHQVADGYHRTLGFQHAGRKSLMAWVATGTERTGPWDREMHDKKLNK